jgi:hypothetical protein
MGTSAIIRTWRPTGMVRRDLCAQHRGGERRSGQIGCTSGDRDPEVALDPFGEVVVEQAEHDAQVFFHRASVQGCFEVGGVVAGHGDQCTAGVDVSGAQDVLSAGVAEDDPHANPPCQLHPPSVLIAFHAHHWHTQIVQLPNQSGADVAQSDDHHMAAGAVGSEYRILGLTSRLWVLVFDHAAMWYSLVSPSRIDLR